MESRTSPQQKIARRASDREIAELSARVAQLESIARTLVDNTSEIVEAWRAASGAFKVLGWIAMAAKPLGYIAAACASAYAFFKTIKGG